MTKAEISSNAFELCQRIAQERTRPLQWVAAAKLQAQALHMLSQGHTPAAIDDWLGDQLADAILKVSMLATNELRGLHHV